jgi:hypothetical protein
VSVGCYESTSILLVRRRRRREKEQRDHGCEEACLDMELMPQVLYVITY